MVKGRSYTWNSATTWSYPLSSGCSQSYTCRHSTFWYTSLSSAFNLAAVRSLAWRMSWIGSSDKRLSAVPQSLVSRSVSSGQTVFFWSSEWAGLEHLFWHLIVFFLYFLSPPPHPCLEPILTIGIRRTINRVIIIIIISTTGSGCCVCLANLF